jgi:hypothetical protein
MKLIDFHKYYPTEKSCRDAFKQKRETEGIVCKKCGSREHKWKNKREQWECKNCFYRTTLKSGTVMENSKLPFQYWFIGMHLLSSTTKTFSAKEIQHQLGHKRYQPIWEMLHKIRSVMGLRDDIYMLEGEVEIDDGFFETVSITRDRNEKLKRGRGSQRQTAVFVCVESKTITDQKVSAKYQKKKKLGFLKMKVLHSLKKKDIKTITEKIVEKGSDLISDKSNSYNDLNVNYSLDAQVIPKEQAMKILPWVNTTISNAKKLLLDVHHRIDDDFLQNYLNEFCFKLNRRYFNDLFDRVLVTAVNYRWNCLGERCG